MKLDMSIVNERQTERVQEMNGGNRVMKIIEMTNQGSKALFCMFIDV